MARVLARWLPWGAIGALCLLAPRRSAAESMYEADGPCGGWGAGIEHYAWGMGVYGGPAIPSNKDSISIAVTGEFPSTGYSFTSRQVRDVGDTVYVDIQIAFAGGFQSDIMIPWRVSACLSPRPPGPLTVAVTVSRQTAFGTVATERREVRLGVVATAGEPASVGIAWMGVTPSGEVLQAVRPGTRASVAVLPTDQWDGTPARLQLSYDPAALAMADAVSTVASRCTARVVASPAGQASLEVGCASWQVGESVASLEAEVLPGFSGWTDIMLDSVTTVEEIARPGTVLRLLEGAVDTGLLMDFDGNGVVGFDDFFMFADSFGSPNTFYDFDGDGRVDFDDFFVFADSFGKTTQY